MKNQTTKQEIEMSVQIQRVINGLNIAEAAQHKRNGFTKHPPELWHTVDRRKYVHINCGGSGAFLCDKKTGELFNIKGYGVADKNKKAKADIGNIATVDPTWLHSRRWNHLR